MTSKILTTWRAAPVAAVAFGVFTLGLDLAVVPLDILTHKTGSGGPVADGLSTAAVVVPAVAVGTLLAARRPRNPIGWVLLAILLLGVSPTNQYAVLDDVPTPTDKKVVPAACPMRRSLAGAIS